LFWGVAVWFLYWSLRRLLELAVLRFRSEREKEIEILVLRHQLRLLERQVTRPQLSPADRALLAAFSRVLPRRTWGPFCVTPATLLRWHPQLVGLGIKLAASTVWTILREAGIEPAPRRLETSWPELLRRQAESILECDFLTVDTLFLKRFYVCSSSS
jgi:putative transposase